MKMRQQKTNRAHKCATGHVAGVRGHRSLFLQNVRVVKGQWADLWKKLALAAISYQKSYI
jgi:hypothetical protein